MAHTQTKITYQLPGRVVCDPMQDQRQDPILRATEVGQHLGGSEYQPSGWYSIKGPVGIGKELLDHLTGPPHICGGGIPPRKIL